jgi:hypothetical protein
MDWRVCFRGDGMTAKYSVGDAAYGNFGQYSRVDVRAGVVTKVTPSGQTTVKFAHREMRFTPFGREVGGVGYGAPSLIDAETYSRLLERQKIQNARAAVRNAIGKAGDILLEDIDAVIAALDAAKVAAAAYKAMLP